MIKDFNIKWFVKNLERWFSRNGRGFPWRNKSASKYQLIMAEVLLQRTKAETVARFYSQFTKRFPSWKSLSRAKGEKLQNFLKPIGLWRQRTTAIKKLSAEMTKRNGHFPKTREEIEKIPAIGQYIANAVLMFCHGQRQPLVDVNMARVLERFFGPRKLADIRYDPYLQQLARKVLPKKKFKEFNWAILDFAALVCKPRKPLCTECPLKSKCRYFMRTQVSKAKRTA
jgi:A/G-specific adenine glycosylase